MSACDDKNVSMSVLYISRTPLYLYIMSVRHSTAHTGSDSSLLVSSYDIKNRFTVCNNSGYHDMSISRRKQTHSRSHVQTGILFKYDHTYKLKMLNILAHCSATLLKMKEHIRGRCCLFPSSVVIKTIL